MAHAGKGIGSRANGQHGAKPAGPESNLDLLDESNLSADIQGRNSLHGDDQNSVTNQRQSVADEKLETDSLIESFEKLDKDHRAETDLGKRTRH